MVPGGNRPSSKFAPEELMAMAIVAAEVAAEFPEAAPQFGQKRLFGGVSDKHPGHFGISH
jgi:hypothetical protein